MSAMARVSEERYMRKWGAWVGLGVCLGGLRRVLGWARVCAWVGLGVYLGGPGFVFGRASNDEKRLETNKLK